MRGCAVLRSRPEFPLRHLRGRRWNPRSTILNPKKKSCSRCVAYRENLLYPPPFRKFFCVPARDFFTRRENVFSARGTIRKNQAFRMTSTTRARSASVFKQCVYVCAGTCMNIWYSPYNVGCREFLAFSDFCQIAEQSVRPNPFR